MFYILKLRAKILKIQKYIPLASSSLSDIFLASVCIVYTWHNLSPESSKFGTIPNSMRK